jgi:hypothetical protein
MLQQYAPQAGDSTLDILRKQQTLLALRQVSFFYKQDRRIQCRLPVAVLQAYSCHHLLDDLIRLHVARLLLCLLTHA